MNRNIFGPAYPNEYEPDINVTQFGWSEFESGGASLIQDYLKQAQELRDECVAILEGLQGALDGIPDIETYYNYIKNAYEDFNDKFPTFERDYASFLLQYETVQQQAGYIQAAYEDFQLGKDFIDDAVLKVNQNMQQISADMIIINGHMAKVETYHRESKGFRDECRAYAEEVRRGKVYRGLWNPQKTNSYPAIPTTNSYWDVMLNAGTDEFVFSGITWKPGNSLIYMLTEAKFEQGINPSVGVDSFNGRRGTIMPETGDYTAEMVGADAKGTAERIATDKITNLKTETNPFPQYVTGTEIPSKVVTSFNGRKGEVFGAESWSSVLVDKPTPTIPVPKDRVRFLIDSAQAGACTINLTEWVSEVSIKDIGGGASKSPIKVVAPSGWTINGRDSEFLDQDFGFVQYVAHSNKTFMTVSGSYGGGGGGGGSSGFPSHGFGMGNKQGGAILAKDFTEDKTRDFNKLLTAGEYTVEGGWLNGATNVATEVGHTGTVKVEVRNFGAGPSYIQTFKSIFNGLVNETVRSGTGTAPNGITWTTWNKAGRYEQELGNRLTINRTNSTGHAYITLKKREERTDLTSGWYNFAAIDMKQGDGTYDPNNPNSGSIGATIVGSRQWDNKKNRLILSLRGAVDGATKSEVALYEDGVNLISGGKAVRFNGIDLLVDNKKVYHEGFKPTVFDIEVRNPDIDTHEEDASQVKSLGVYLKEIEEKLAKLEALEARLLRLETK